MINIGKVNTLSVVKQHDADIYLASGGSNKVLLVDKRPPICQIGDSLTVFVYVDATGHLAATTQIPLAQVDEIAFLKVASLNYTGAFLNWGLPKELLVPFSEQHHDMEVGKSYLVKLFLDAKNRIVASTKIDKFLHEEAHNFVVNQPVSIMIAEQTDLGFKVIVNHTHWGLLYANEVFQPLHKGQKIEAYVKRLRDDSKLDVSLFAAGYGKVNTLTEQILSKLKENNGVLALGDKSPPEAIYAAFGVSKKVFKQATGALYKQQLIRMNKDEIYLL